jgi:membrane protein DedA with SNARE-associated domain
MNLEQLLDTYGYPALFVGTFAEGETVLVLGGLLAHRGHLELAAVIATAFVAAVSGNQLYFYLGRRHARGFLDRFPRLRSQATAALRRIENNEVKWAFAMRFMWGFRIAMPVALGMTNMRAGLYLGINFVTGLLWAALFALVGFSASGAFGRVLADVRQHEKWIIVAFLAAASIVLAMRWRRARHG